MRSMTVAMLLGMSVAGGSVSANAATIENAVVERDADGIAVVRWRSSPIDAPIDVTIVSPQQQVRVLSDDDRDGRHELTPADASRRPIIELTTPDRNTVVVAERVLPLQGGRNFRDLGGYRTSDGQRVKWGKVFRSGTMAQLTDADYELLSELGIRVVCDFRANDEREREPTAWRTRGEQPRYLARDYTLESNLRAIFAAGKPTADSVRAAMTNFYGELAYSHVDNYRAMFKSLAAGEAPLAFNCSAGKDRTGVAAALLLTLLGVPRETVVDDYALSERVVNYETEFVAQGQQTGLATSRSADSLSRLPAEVRAPLLRSDPEYIRAALRSIEQREGSMDAYFEKVLNLSMAERASIRKLLLDPA